MGGILPWLTRRRPLGGAVRPAFEWAAGRGARRRATSPAQPQRPAAARGEHSATEDVLIVGAGPVGIYTSILLARMGVSSVVIEKTGTSFENTDDERRAHPRAHVLHTRSMELLREIGLAEEVQREMPPLVQWKYFRYCTALVGTDLAAVDHCDDSDGAYSNLVRACTSSTHPHMCTRCSLLGSTRPSTCSNAKRCSDSACDAVLRR
jgi:hypothetical protein